MSVSASTPNTIEALISLSGFGLVTNATEAALSCSRTCFSAMSKDDDDLQRLLLREGC